MDTVDARLRALDPLLRTMAAESVWSPSAREDCVQEARITVWRILQERPDAPPAYLHKSARRRIKEVSQTGRMTGGTYPRGVKADPLRGRPVSLSALGDMEQGKPVHSERTDRVRDAVDALPEAEREFIRRRFWERVRSRELSWSTWPAAREHLREALDLAA